METSAQLAKCSKLKRVFTKEDIDNSLKDMETFKKYYLVPTVNEHYFCLACSSSMPMEVWERHAVKHSAGSENTGVCYICCSRGMANNNNKSMHYASSKHAGAEIRKGRYMMCFTCGGCFAPGSTHNPTHTSVVFPTLLDEDEYKNEIALCKEDVKNNEAYISRSKTNSSTTCPERNHDATRMALLFLERGTRNEDGYVFASICENHLMIPTNGNDISGYGIILEEPEKTKKGRTPLCVFCGYLATLGIGSGHRSAVHKATMPEDYALKFGRDWAIILYPEYYVEGDDEANSDSSAVSEVKFQGKKKKKKTKKFSHEVPSEESEESDEEVIPENTEQIKAKVEIVQEEKGQSSTELFSEGEMWPPIDLPPEHKYKNNKK